MFTKALFSKVAIRFEATAVFGNRAISICANVLYIEIRPFKVAMEQFIYKYGIWSIFEVNLFEGTAEEAEMSRLGVSVALS